MIDYSTVLNQRIQAVPPSAIRKFFDIMEEMPEASDQQPDSVLRDAIECLPEEMRIPLLLHYMEGYKLREIAGTLGVSLPQITSRLFRVRRLLRDMLEEEAER